MSRKFNYFPRTPWTNPNGGTTIEKQTNELPAGEKTVTDVVNKGAELEQKPETTSEVAEEKSEGEEKVLPEEK